MVYNLLITPNILVLEKSKNSAMSTLSYGKDSKKFTISHIFSLETPSSWGETPN
jgi:hypothetical protein